MNPSVWRPIAIALLTFILGAGATWANHDSERTALTADLAAINRQIVTMQVEQARLEEKVDLLLKQMVK